jgi:hypothetical protein
VQDAGESPLVDARGSCLLYAGSEASQAGKLARLLHAGGKQSGGEGQEVVGKVAPGVVVQVERQLALLRL